jgi:CHAT domain-containing protein
MAIDRHPEAERLAEYADGVLSAADRVEIERHLAECADCRAVVAETMTYLRAEPTALTSAPRVIPFRSRRWVTGTAAILAAAAAFLVAARVVSPDWINRALGRGERPELQELIAAVAKEPTRPVEGRLSGGFKYGPAPHPTRGAGEREASPDVRIAAARIEKQAGTSDTAAKSAALGVAYLAVHDFDRAVAALERAVRDEPSNAGAQSDLSAAYLARAAWMGRTEDLPKALAAAERSIAAEPRRAEAFFNRALALEGLHLDSQAAEAWSAYTRLESSGPWATEAATKASDAKSRTISKLTDPANPRHQELRERIEDELLTRWGAAVAAGESDGAARALAESERSARALMRDGGDSMPSDEVLLIKRVEQGGQSVGLRTLAEAHVLYGRARHEFVENRLQQASEMMAAAAVAFKRSNSPYAAWAPIYKAIAMRIGGSADAALDQLDAVSPGVAPAGYFNLRGRLAWTRGAALGRLGRFDQARDALRQAVLEFTRAGEIENLAINEMGLAEAEWYLGATADMWSHEVNALSRLDSVRSVPRRNAVLLEAATFALSDGLPESALYFQNALVELAEKSGLQLGRADVYRGRARILGRLGRQTAALQDVNIAHDALTAIDDAGLRARATAELDRIRAELYVSVDSRKAVAAATSALGYLGPNGHAIRTAEVLTLRARAFERLNDPGHARQDFRAAIDTLEGIRAGLAQVQDRMQAVEGQREAFQGLVRLEAATLNNSDNALRVAEQGRARTLLDLAPAVETGSVDPGVARNRLANDTVVVFFSVLSDQVLVWVLTNTDTHFFSRPIPAARLSESVSQLRALVDGGVDFSRFANDAQMLSQQLIMPALEMAPEKSRVVFVPDGPLAGVPFGILPDNRGKPILSSRSVVVSPSFTSFLANSTRLTEFSARSVLAVGDGQNPASTGFVRLTRADDEAIAVGKLYPLATVLTAADATRTGLLGDSRDVMHFAGHVVSNYEFPMLSRILLASGSTGDSTGTLLASDLMRFRFTTTRVVVLASCEGAAGRVVGGEGSLSVGRAFLQAGVPSVIANLWPLDDEVHSLMTGFHQQLRQHSDPSTALRLSQVEWLREHGWNGPVRAWGGFVAMGGINSRS